MLIHFSFRLPYQWRLSNVALLIKPYAFPLQLERRAKLGLPLGHPAPEKLSTPFANEKQVLIFCSDVYRLYLIFLYKTISSKSITLFSSGNCRMRIQSIINVLFLIFNIRIQFVSVLLQNRNT